MKNFKCFSSKIIFDTISTIFYANRARFATKKECKRKKKEADKKQPLRRYCDTTPVFHFVKHEQGRLKTAVYVKSGCRRSFPSLRPPCIKEAVVAVSHLLGPLVQRGLSPLGDWGIVRSQPLSRQSRQLPLTGEPPRLFCF